MSDRRRTDPAPRSWFRSRRFYTNEGKWYFNTREGTEEGPFRDMKEAENRLKEYIKIVNSGFMPHDSTLKMEPIDKA